MANDWLFDETGNIVIENGSPVYISGVDEIKQTLLTNLSTNLGSFEYNEDIGIDLDWLYTGEINTGEIKSAVKNCIMQDDRVIGLDQMDVSLDGTKVNIHLVVATTLGTIDFTKEMNDNAT